VGGGCEDGVERGRRAAGRSAGVASIRVADELVWWDGRPGPGRIERSGRGGTRAGGGGGGRAARQVRAEGQEKREAREREKLADSAEHSTQNIGPFWRAAPISLYRLFLHL
jgi:hypothetical protein